MLGNNMHLKECNEFILKCSWHTSSAPSEQQNLEAKRHKKEHSSTAPHEEVGDYDTSSFTTAAQDQEHDMMASCSSSSCGTTDSLPALGTLLPDQNNIPEEIKIKPYDALWLDIPDDDRSTPSCDPDEITTGWDEDVAALLTENSIVGTEATADPLDSALLQESINEQYACIPNRESFCHISKWQWSPPSDPPPGRLAEGYSF